MSWSASSKAHFLSEIWLRTRIFRSGRYQALTTTIQRLIHQEELLVAWASAVIKRSRVRSSSKLDFPQELLVLDLTSTNEWDPVTSCITTTVRTSLCLSLTAIVFSGLTAVERLFTSFCKNWNWCFILCMWWRWRPLCGSFWNSNGNIIPNGSSEKTLRRKRRISGHMHVFSTNLHLLLLLLLLHLQYYAFCVVSNETISS